MKLNAGLNNAWPTPIYKTSITEEQRSSLINSIMLVDDIAKSDGVEQNILKQGASRSLIDDVPLLESLAEEKYDEFFRDVFELDISRMNYFLKGWLAGGMQGYNMDTHNHHGAQFASVFYLLAEDSGAGGEIVLQDPRFNANRGYMDPFRQMFESIVHQPSTGDVLIFPGFLYHFVRQSTSKMRMAVPVDMFISL